MKRLFAIMLVLCLVFTVLPMPATAQETEVTSGTCEGRLNELTWKFEDGTLTITGDDYAIDSTPWDHLKDRIHSIVFAGKLTLIGGNFRGFPNLTNIVWPDGLVSLEQNAFSDCPRLESVSLPDSITNISSYVFSRCVSLWYVKLPSNLKEIYAAFDGTTALTEIILPSGLTKIEKSFRGSGLTSITIPSSVTRIGGNAFSGCRYLENIVFIGHAPTITEKPFDQVTATVYYRSGDSSWTNDFQQKFGGNLTWTGVASPADVDVRVPKTWKFENGVLTIWGESEMQSYPWIGLNRYVKAIDIQEGVTSIGAFAECIELTSVSIAESVTTINQGAFRSCESLTNITLPDSITKMGERVFAWCSSLETVNIPSGLTYIPADMFYGCGSLASIDIPDGVTEIQNAAFMKCTGLQSITIPGSVTRIGTNALKECTSLSDIKFAGDAPIIEDTAFQYVTATAYYPRDNATWTEEARQNYGGTITWVPYCAEHDYQAVTTEANCIQDGGTVNTCSICQDSYVSSFVPATGQHTYTDGADTDCDVCGSVRDLDMPTTPMYRLYNPNSGEHFYTGSLEEREMLIAAGWDYEGIAWNAPTNSGDPVHRLYNPNSGDHHYTMSDEERDMLVGYGWNYEGVCWNSATSDNLPLYRLYNPNAVCGSHHYTGSEEERDFLVSVDWIYEGLGWFGMLR